MVAIELCHDGTKRLTAVYKEIGFRSLVNDILFRCIINVIGF